MLHDLRYALRLFRRRPGVAALVVVTLAIGIAATTIVFSLSDAILWHPLPFSHADRLVTVHAMVPPVPAGAERPSLDAWTAHGQILEHLNPFTMDAVTIEVGGEPREATVSDISLGLFEAIGAAPAWGRDFVADDYRSGTSPVILSADLWRRMQSAGAGGGDRAIRVNGAVCTIVGVMAPGFTFPVGRVAMWRPYVPVAAGSATPNAPTNLAALGVLKPGVTLVQAEAFAKATSPNVLLGPGHLTVHVAPFLTTMDTTVAALRALIGAVGVLFLIAVGNAGNVLLAEAIRRDGEMALRASLGASRARLARQVMTETLLLSGAAAALALLVASWSLDALVASVPYIMSFQALRPIRLDWRTLAFATAVTVAAGLAASYVSAFRASRANVQGALSGLRAGAVARSRARSTLTIAQIAATLVLLAAAGLLGNGFVRLSRQNVGFDPAHLVNLELSIPEWRYPTESVRHSY